MARLFLVLVLGVVCSLQSSFSFPTSLQTFSDVRKNSTGSSSELESLLSDFGLPFCLGKNLYIGLRGPSSDQRFGPYFAF